MDYPESKQNSRLTYKINHTNLNDGFVNSDIIEEKLLTYLASKLLGSQTNRLPNRI